MTYVLSYKSHRIYKNRVRFCAVQQEVYERSGSRYGSDVPTGYYTTYLLKLIQVLNSPEKF